jgi:hypothetical protein
MAYEATEVAVSKSQDAIRKLIYAHQGTGVMLLSHPPREGFEAMVTMSGQAYHIRVMATCQPVSKTAKNGYRQKVAAVYAKDVEQEERRVWRVLYWHLKAMFEAADAGVIDIRDIIMPYVVLRDGRTLADHIKPQMETLMTADPARLLSAGR